jgi:hypothetical protein
MPPRDCAAILFAGHPSPERALIMSNKYLALAAALLGVVVAGCDRAEDGTDDGGYAVVSLFDPVAINPSLCGSPAIPYPNNALFSGFADPTLNIPNPSNAPFVTAANLTDGFSTTASIFTDVLGTVDYATADEAVLVFEADATPRFLQYGVDFTVQRSDAMAQMSGSGHSTGTCTGLAPARFMPISQQRSRLLIEPLKPLNASTTYIVAVTKALKSVDGKPIAASEQFPVTNSDTKVCRLASGESGTEPLCTDLAAARAYGATIAPVLGVMSAAQLTTIETLRRALIRPTVTGLKAGYSALNGGATLNDSDLAIAWSFTTQSVSKTLANINTTPFSAPRTLGVGPTNLNTNQINAGLAATANVYAGSVSLPYFLNVASDAAIGTSPAILATFFAADATQPDVSASFLGQVPCGAFATGASVNGIVQGPSASTTICYPRPVLRSSQTVPLLVTVPNANAPGNCGGRGTIAGSFASGTCVAPATGWPVVIFQHGITRNRTDMLAIAPTLASAGFVVVAIDLPLHGLVDATAAVSPGCGTGATNALYAGAAERTFGVDYVSNTTGAAGPDGRIDCSGTHFVNLSSLITSRDNLRQAQSDILHLAKSVNGLNFDGDTNTDEIAETNLRFAGQSLGAIVGTTVMGVDVGADAAADGTDEAFGAASLNVPGGGIAKLLDASASFGPRIAAGLAAGFVFEGTDTYETFIRFAQHLVDPADPINYAVAANANHPIHMTMVIGDAVVPNDAGTTCPEPLDLPFGFGATATTVDAAGTAAASGQAGAALIAHCPPLVIPATATLSAITYQDETLITGYLSGTQPLAALMGLTTRTMGSAPFTAQASAAADTLVVFGPDTAEHGTLLSPDSSAVAGADATFAAATCAQQKQTATFLATSGALLPIGGSCP